MIYKVAKAEEIESPAQNIISSKGLRKLRYIFYFIAIFMLVLVVALDKSDIPGKHAWVSIGSAICVAAMYLLMIYYQYVAFPYKQKKLKAIIDAFANILALIAIIVTFISVVFTGKANALYADLATTMISNILFGVIMGVLLSRVFFPFWDIHSAYRKI